MESAAVAGRSCTPVNMGSTWTCTSPVIPQGPLAQDVVDHGRVEQNNTGLWQHMGCHMRRRQELADFHGLPANFAELTNGRLGVGVGYQGLPHLESYGCWACIRSGGFQLRFRALPPKQASSEGGRIPPVAGAPRRLDA